MSNNRKTMAISIISSLIVTLTTAAFAEDWHYSIIVDAGSTGSRLHLFRYHTETSLPVIEDIPLSSNKTTVALASFTQDPNAVKSSLDNLFNTAITTLNNEGIDPKIISVSILGTAGMRLLPLNEQKDIYNNISDYLTHQHSFASITARTISGEEEGIYDWLDVNYLTKNFNDPEHTLGCIDMGGASVEIVFALKEAQLSTSNTTTLTINGQQYTLYSKSILGLGQDEARKNINKNNTATSCYPTGYLSPSNNSNSTFDFNACDTIYSTQVLESALSKNDKLSIPSGQKFVGLGSIYYAFQFFNPTTTTEQATSTPGKATLESAINSICATSWENLKQRYPANNYLANYCANGVYIDELLFGKNGYQLQDSQLYQVVNTINGQAIDWPLGAVLYQLGSVDNSASSSSTTSAS